MDRGITYAGQIPLDTDGLFGQASAYEGLAWLAQGVIGSTGPYVTDLTCTQTTVASMAVLLNPGQLFQLETFDSVAYSDLGTNANQIVKQGLLRAPATLGCAAPVTAGFSINYLIQVAFNTVDGGSVVLPYYNAANPAVAFAGPNGSGTSQNTKRFDQLVATAKAGTAAATGTQVTPAPDAGYVGLFVVTVAQGQTQITSSSISQLATAPFIDPGAKLSQLPSSFQNGQWTWAGSLGGSANALTATLSPAPASLTAGLVVRGKSIAANTGAVTLNVNGLGAVAVKRIDGTSALIGGEIGAAGQSLTFEYNGSVFVIRSPLSPLFPGALAPFQSTNNATQSLSNNTTTAVSCGASGSLAGVGSLTGGVFTFTRAGVYSIFTAITANIVTSGAANLLARLLPFENGAYVGYGAPQDSTYAPGAGTFVFNVTSTISLYCPAGTTISIDAFLSATANYTSGAVTSCGMQIAILS